MEIVVCVKQVPSCQVNTNPRTGHLIRGNDAQLNPYDRYALEAALRVRDAVGGRITAITMGPETAHKTLQEAAAMGADRLILLSDPAFSGADVYATAATLACAIKQLCGSFHLVLCGRQSTDGSTAQIGPALASMLNLPFCSWTRQILSLCPQGVLVEQQVSEGIQTVQLTFPCLLSVEPEIGTPRMPGIRQSLMALHAPIHTYTAADLPGGAQHFGQKGSKTKVTRVYAPPTRKTGITPCLCPPSDAAAKILELVHEVIT